MPKKSYLETSPEKFQQQVGSGCCSTDCPTPTGSRLSALVLPPPDSSSLTEDPLKSPSDGGSIKVVNVDLMEDLLENPMFHGSGESGEPSIDLLLFWNQRIPVRQKG